MLGSRIARLRAGIAALGRRGRGAAPATSLVTEADVRAGYRLLLGRAPDPDGWRTFSALAGKAEVADLVTALLSSEEFRRTPMHAALLRREHEDLERVDIGDGLALLVSAHDLSNQGLRRTGTYEAHLARALDAALAPGTSVCAVGANVGYHVVRAARRVGTAGRVYAFEARPANAQLVLRNVARNGLGNVVVLPVAASDRHGVLRYVAAQGTNGWVEPLGEGVASDPRALDGATLVQSVRLDDLLELMAPIRVLQLDVEGAEGLVLRGARRLLERDRPVVFSELCLGQLERTSQMSGEEYLSLLLPLGYEFAVLGFDGEDVPFGEDADALCAHARRQQAAHVDVRCTPR